MSRKPGLVLSRTKVEIEEVTTRHKKVCGDCGRCPRARRLLVILGSGRSAKTEVRCSDCGYAWLDDMHRLFARACEYLSTGQGTIRFPKPKAPKE